MKYEYVIGSVLSFIIASTALAATNSPQPGSTNVGMTSAQPSGTGMSLPASGAAAPNMMPTPSAGFSSSNGAAPSMMPAPTSGASMPPSNGAATTNTMSPTSSGSSQGMPSSGMSQSSPNSGVAPSVGSVTSQPSSTMPSQSSTNPQGH